jgi:hypothetical protein
MQRPRQRSKALKSMDNDDDDDVFKMDPIVLEDEYPYHYSEYKVTR